MSKRLFYIDLLKTIGLLAVILAHVNPPIWLKQMRSFDVSLLVIVSGYLAGMGSYSADFLDYRNVFQYIKKRIHRIVIPAWIFIIIFLPIQAFLYRVPTIREVILTLTFQQDCGLLGYLWIVWVFFVCACIVPFISRIRFNLNNLIIWFFVLVVIEIVINYTNFENNRLLYCTIFTIVPYGFLTYLGINLEKMNVKRMAVIAGFIFIAYSLSLYFKEGIFVLTSKYKYPAQIYYLSYGIFTSFILYSIVNKYSPFLNKLITFISSHTLWIYFWHTLILYGLQYIMPHGKWWVMFPIVISVSMAITYVQSLIVDKNIQRIPVLKYFNG